MNKGTPSEYAAASMLLRAPTFTERFEDQLNDSEQAIEWFPIVEKQDTLSDGERVLVRLAVELWTGRGDVFVSDLVHYLDAPNLDLAIRAIRIKRAMNHGGTSRAFADCENCVRIDGGRFKCVECGREYQTTRKGDDVLLGVPSVAEPCG